MGGVVVNDVAWLTAELSSKGLRSMQGRILERVNGNSELENIARNFGSELIELSRGCYISISGIAAVLTAKARLYDALKVQNIKNRTRVSITNAPRNYGIAYYQNRLYLPLDKLNVFLEKYKKEILGPLTLADYGARMSDLENITHGQITVKGVKEFKLNELVVTANTLAISDLKTSRELKGLRERGAAYESISKIGEHSSRIYYPLDILGNDRLAELPLDKVYIKASLFLRRLTR